MKCISRAICVVVSAAVFASQTAAASSDWAVVQGLASGAGVRLDLKTGKSVSGAVDHVTADAVYLQTKKEAATINREEISRLYVKKKARSAMLILAGAGAGAAAGGAIGAKIMEKEKGYGGAVAGTVVLFSLIGAGVGALARGSGKTLVYESPSSKR